MAADVPPTTLEALVARLDKQAAAIRALRKQVADLAALVEAGARSSTAAQCVVGVPETSMRGTFVPVPLCCLCGEPKAPGRRALTCERCSALRATLLKTPGSDRTPIMRDSCFNCGHPHKLSTRYLCVPCSESFKEWKIGR